MARFVPCFFAFFLSMATAASAQPFGSGWSLASAASTLTFTSTKNTDVFERGSFATLTGDISAEGDVRIAVELESVDTGIALRDARMAALLFETYKHPLAELSARITPKQLDGLAQDRKLDLDLPARLALNGVTQEIGVALTVTMITDEIVSIALSEPLTVSLSDFDLLVGLKKLEAAAGVPILPRTEIEAELVFQATSPNSRGLVPQAAMAACFKRVETIGASDQVYFTSGSAELEKKSFALLDAIADTIRQCPGLVVNIEGHTDDVGDEDFNLGLSEERAASVVQYLTEVGIAPDRLEAMGFGEARPIADNATRRGRWKNRRIEFVPRAKEARES